ncbi:MAG TPA: nucleoside 2-deoxyribosyltransferase domain-containing protein [Gemmataceae bacterium]|nr:nucleoside 2-deoxyribosyltransferase domain-containing protein [Gemmataceae bacterium]
MARVVKPPAPLPLDEQTPKVFLAGSIEMGLAEDWQTQFENSLSDLDVLLLNPRRDEWDASWEQSITNPSFREQVEWELAGLERAEVVAMYFAPPTKAPVTLLELGLCARDGRLVVCCPAGYWRRGNVEVVCRRYGVPLLDSLPDLVAEVRRRLGAEASPSA